MMALRSVPAPAHWPVLMTGQEIFRVRDGKLAEVGTRKTSRNTPHFRLEPLQTNHVPRRTVPTAIIYHRLLSLAG